MSKKLISAILAATFMLSGCAGIPSSSQVYFGEEVSEDGAAPFVRVIARPPSLGMNPDEIVRGFLDASKDPSDDYGIAREYLSEESADSWNPTTGIEIYFANTMQISGSAPDLIATAASQGNLSALGRYSSADPNAQISSSFALQQDISGEWRISQLRNGILLSSGDVDRSFRSFPIYFFNPSFTSLISDSVLVPVSRSGAATSLVRSLLDGPSPYLLPVATTAFPIGTTLTFGSVPILNGVAQVDLSDEILGADELTRRALSAQLVWTLSVLPNVSGVKISVSGQPFVLTDIGVIQTTQDWNNLSPLLNPDLVSLNVIRNEKVLTVSPTSEQIRAAAPASLLFGSADPGSTRIAAVTSDLQSLLVADPDSLLFNVVAQGESLSRPSWDNDGRLFYADFGQGITEISDEGIARRVTADASRLGSTEQIKQIALAPDGVRVVVVFSDGVIDVIAVGAIFRTNLVTRIIGLSRIEQSVVRVRDVAWGTPTSILALASDQAGGERLFDFSLSDGKVVTRSSPAGAQTIAVDGAGKIFASVVDGTNQAIYQLGVGTWSEITTGTGVFFSR